MLELPLWCSFRYGCRIASSAVRIIMYYVSSPLPLQPNSRGLVIILLWAPGHFRIQSQRRSFRGRWR